MRDCENCKHRVMKVEVGKGTPPEHFWGCECWECEFEPTTKNDLGVDCVSRKAAEDITWQDPSYTDPLNVLTEVRDKIRELPSVTPQLSAPEVTALAEWTEKLTKASEEAYNKGYADGVKSVNICPHCGEYIGEEE